MLYIIIGASGSEPHINQKIAVAIRIRRPSARRARAQIDTVKIVSVDRALTRNVAHPNN